MQSFISLLAVQTFAFKIPAAARSAVTGEAWWDYPTQGFYAMYERMDGVEDEMTVEQCRGEELSLGNTKKCRDSQK